MRSKLYALFVAFGLLVGGASLAGGTVYQSRDEALSRAFPAPEQVEKINLYLTDAELEQVYRASGVKPDSALYTIYVGKNEEEVTGYAVIEAAIVRTLPETVLVVLEPDGTLRSVEILAFFEPEEYKPSARWLRQFFGQKLSPQLRVGGDIHALTGATLSAQAITRQARKTAAILFTHLGKAQP